jgi:hypothetical protein
MRYGKDSVPVLRNANRLDGRWCFTVRLKPYLD